MSFYIFIMPYYYIYIEFFTYIIAQLLFLWTADLREIYAKLFRKNYKLFLWIADLREIYAKLFTNVRDRTYQNEDANRCNGSEAQRTNADNIRQSQNHMLGTSKTTKC